MSGPAPPPWLSPALSVWLAIDAPCVTVWRRFIALAQAGGPSSADAVEAGAALLEERRTGYNTYSETTCDELKCRGLDKCKEGCQGVIKVKLF